MLANTLAKLPSAVQAFTMTQSIVGESFFETVYPGQFFDKQQQKKAAEALAKTDIAQPAIGAVSLALGKP